MTMVTTGKTRMIDGGTAKTLAAHNY